VGSGVNNETASSDGCSPEDVFLEFGDEAGRSGRMEGSDLDLDHLYSFQKSINTKL